MKSSAIERLPNPELPHQNDVLATNESREAVEKNPASTIEEDVMIADSLKLYLTQMGRVREKLLTREQEVALAKKIEKGDLDAKDELIESNLRLVVSITKNRTDNADEHLEMIQDGAFGLIRAAEKFDWRKGFKFSTYATWWIKQSVQRGRDDKESTIRLPIHMKGDIRKIKKAQREHEAIWGTAPTLDELCDLTGIKDPAKVQAFLDYDAFINLVPLDKKVGDDNDTSVGDYVADRSIDIAEDAVLSADVQALRRAIKYNLGAKEKIVIVKRFGLNGIIPMTLDEIAQDMGLTRERVRQIEIASVKKLREFINETGVLEA